jgi:hypothetical protein
VHTVQIIFNMFRQRPMDLFFGEAQRRQIGIIARLPLSSGMLTGKLTRTSAFEPGDHRQGNRRGDWFDRGETFSGLDYETGLQAVDELRALLPEGITLTQMALRWILMSPAVTCAIPGAKHHSQVEENVSAADLPALSDETMSKVREIYDRLVRPQVHHYWFYPSPHWYRLSAMFNQYQSLWISPVPARKMSARRVWMRIHAWLIASAFGPSTWGAAGSSRWGPAIRMKPRSADCVSGGREKRYMSITAD